MSLPRDRAQYAAEKWLRVRDDKGKVGVAVEYSSDGETDVLKVMYPDDLPPRWVDTLDLELVPRGWASGYPRLPRP